MAIATLMIGFLVGEAGAATVVTTGGALGTPLAAGAIDIEGDGFADVNFVVLASFGALDRIEAGAIDFGLTGNSGSIATGSPCSSNCAWVREVDTFFAPDQTGVNEATTGFRGNVFNSADNWSKVHFTSGDGWVQWSFGPTFADVTPLVFVREDVGEDLSAADAEALAYPGATLLGGQVSAGAAPVLQNGGGTVRLEQPRVDFVARPVFFVEVCGDGVLASPAEECDDGNTLPGDGCSAQCEVEAQVTLFGTAEGGSVSVTVDGVTLPVVTLVGTSALDVLGDLAAAINADPTLQGLGTTGAVLGGVLVTNGTVSDFTILDPGLTESPPVAVPALGPWGVGALAALLLGAGAGRLRRRTPLASSSGRG